MPHNICLALYAYFIGGIYISSIDLMNSKKTMLLGVSQLFLNLQVIELLKTLSFLCPVDVMQE